MSTPTDRLAAVLSRWYAGQSSIRRLWAVDDREARISVFVTLEPTFDGDDALPIWLAQSDAWRHELRVLTDRDVRLELLAAGTSEPAHAETTIAELHWRDPWMCA